MGDKSAIHWTDATWNPITGCTKVSQGCKNCYAKFQAWPRLAASKQTVYFGRKFEDVQCHPERLEQPLRWRKPRRVFVNSMSDLFHEDVPFEFIAAVFGVMAAAERHTFQVLTKRPERMQSFFKWIVMQDRGFEPTPGRLHACSTALGYEAEYHERSDGGPLHTKHGADPVGLWPLPNVWLGVSVEDQETADGRIPLLLDTPAAVRFVSYEPALGPVDFTLRSHRIDGWDEDWKYDTLSGHEWASPRDDSEPSSNALDWLIVGGESGPKARPCDVNWIRDAVRQCRDARVPCFVKQIGARPVCTVTDQREPFPIDLVSRKGADPNEWPESLRVREYPDAGQATR